MPLPVTASEPRTGKFPPEWTNASRGPERRPCPRWRGRDAGVQGWNRQRARFLSGSGPERFHEINSGLRVLDLRFQLSAPSRKGPRPAGPCPVPSGGPDDHSPEAESGADGKNRYRYSVTDDDRNPNRSIDFIQFPDVHWMNLSGWGNPLFPGLSVRWVETVRVFRGATHGEP